MVGAAGTKPDHGNVDAIVRADHVCHGVPGGDRSGREADVLHEDATGKRGHCAFLFSFCGYRGWCGADFALNQIALGASESRRREVFNHP